jgi:signal transduction histidine kinase
MASLSPEVRKAGHTLTLDCPEGIQLDTFPGPLAQVLSNLVSNAIGHAYDRGRGGTIALAAQQAGSDVILTVTDFGRGIPPEIMPKIYDPFFTTKRGSGGTGLGLNIVFNIVTDTLRGRIECQSSVGVGTCFTVRMPRYTTR